MVYVAPIRYAPPQEMPGGWWGVLNGLFKWIMEQLRRAYESGYMAGKLDALRACKERENRNSKHEYKTLKLSGSSVKSDELEQFLAGFRPAH